MVKKEFVVNNFLLDHDSPEDFYLPRFQCMGSVGLVFLRLIFTIYTVTCYSFNIAYTIHNSNVVNFFKDLINWNYSIVVIYFTCVFITTGSEALFHWRERRKGQVDCKSIESSNTLNYFNSTIKTSTVNDPAKILGDKLRQEYVSYSDFSRVKRPEKKNLEKGSFDDGNQSKQSSCAYKLVWVLRNIALTMSATIAVGYWSFLHNYTEKITSDFNGFLSLDSHGINLFLMLIDMFFSRIPHRLLHFIHPLMVGCLYIGFHIAYWKLTGDIVYGITDWKNSTGWTAGAFMGLLGSIFAFHLILYLLYAAIAGTNCRTKIGYLMFMFVFLFIILVVFTVVI